MTYNELNFPSFEIALQLWQSGVLRKWKPEDDWEWWWVWDTEDPKMAFSSGILHYTDIQNIISKMNIQYIPCPSLGEMMERLYKKNCSIDKNWEDWHIHNYSGTVIGKADTAPNAAAKGLIGGDLSAA